MEWLQGLQPWQWYVLAVILLILEALIPGAIFMWMGFAAAVVGVLLWLHPVSWETQFVLFAVLSVIDIVGWRYYRKRYPPPPSPAPLLNKRMERYIGTVLTLDQPIIDGTGQVHMKDTLWTVSGPDLPAGAKIKVVGFNGPVLRVEPVQ